MSNKESLIIAIILPILIIAGFSLFVSSSIDVKKQQDILTNESEKLKVKAVESSESTKSAMQEETKNLTAPEMQIDPSKKYTATMITTKGSIVIELNTTKTPITTNNFIYLANKGFYTNTIFHRAIKGFMIQGGDPKGDGTGGPGYKFADEAFDGPYTRGTIAMANAGPNTNGSQFFIMHKDYPLPANYVIFGKAISGFETIDAIAEADVTISNSGEKSKPVAPVSILSITIKAL